MNQPSKKLCFMLFLIMWMFNVYAMQDPDMYTSEQSDYDLESEMNDALKRYEIYFDTINYLESIYAEFDYPDLAEYVNEQMKSENIRFENKNVSSEIDLIISNLQTHIGVERFTASDAGLSYEDIGQIAKELEQHKYIKTFLSKNQQIGDEGATAIAKHLLTENSRIETINLWNENIGSTGFKSMVEQLYENKSLKLLDLHDNKINDDALGINTKDINKDIETLDLSKNFIGDKGCKFIANSFTGLNILYLNHNNVRTKGLIALLEIETLETIKLRYNNINDDDVLEFNTPQIQKTNQLRNLDLSGNNITIKGLFALLYLLKWNVSRRHFNIDLFDNPIRLTEENIKEIKKLEDSPGRVTIWIYEDAIEEDKKERIINTFGDYGININLKKNYKK